jgi:hypothetical protein
MLLLSMTTILQLLQQLATFPFGGNHRTIFIILLELCVQAYRLLLQIVVVVAVSAIPLPLR